LAHCFLNYLDPTAITAFVLEIIVALWFQRHLKYLNKKLDEGAGATAASEEAVVHAARLENAGVADVLAARRGWRYMT
jgi:hypothetical protein